MSEGPRYAIYWAPAADDPLSTAGAAWLGRDPAGAPVGLRPEFAALDAITAAPRVYGFHATLKPPMHLLPAASRAELLAALAAVAASVPTFALPPLAVTDWHGFLCLRETRESAGLQALCDAMVAGLDPLRAELSDRELTRRRTDRLSEAQDANLRRWGYPEVFATWFFHMTLTRRLSEAERATARPAAEAWFADALAHARMVDDVSLFEQPARDAPFMLAARVRLGR